MSLRNFNQNSYGLSQALIGIFPNPIASQRAPTTADRGEVGQVWIDIPNNDAYIVTSIVAGSTSWVNIGGGGGVFNTLTVTGQITSTNGNIGSGGSITAVTSVNAGTSMSAGTTITAAGDIASTAGDINTLAGDISSAGSVSAGTTVTAGTGVTATTGNIVATAGNITTSAGSITSATTLTATLGNITATNGDFVCSTNTKGFTTGGGAKIISAAGDPNGVTTAAKGSLYLRLDGSSTSTRAYINTDGATAWTAVTTAS